MADNKGKHTVDGGGGPTALPDDEIRMTVKDIPVYVSEDVKNLFDGLEVKNVKMNSEGKTNQCDVLISASNPKASEAVKNLKESNPLMRGKTMKVSFSKDKRKIDGGGAAANSDEQNDFSQGSEVEIEGIPAGASNNEIKNQLQSIVEEILGKKPPAQVKTHQEGDNRKAHVKFNVPFPSKVIPKLKNADLKGALQGAKITVVRNIQDVVKLPYIINDDAEKYIEFIEKLRKKVVNVDGAVDIFEDGSGRGAHPVLAELATTDNPPQWIEITMGVEREWRIPLSPKNKWEITLAVRKDNLYVVGFENKNGWFQLGGTDHELPKCYKATLLSDWYVDYPGMMNFVNSDQVKETMKFIRLGKASAERAVRRLSMYPLYDNDDDNPTRLGLMGLIMMISEAARMNPILDTIAGGWNGGAVLTSRHLDIIWDWKNMSDALLRWKESHYKKWPEERDDSPGRALASIHLVLNSKYLRGSGRTWVEILSVSNFHSSGTRCLTITVFDEENQACNIYDSTWQQPQKEINRLELQPGRCISGYESFSFEVTIKRFSYGPIIRKFKWACRKQEGCVIELVSRNLILDPGRKIDVTYLVMSDAVKATVEVKLRPKGGSEKFDKTQEKKYTVRGKISARIDNFEDKGQIMLFSSAKGEKIRRMTNLLKRSDVMVPRDNLLHIDMRDLVITDDSGQEVDNIEYHRLSFKFRTSSPPAKLNVTEVVQVGVTWASQGAKMTKGPEAVGRRLVFYQHDFLGYTQLIDGMRRQLAKTNPSREKVLDHPVLAKPDEEQASWIHITVRVGQSSSRTLAIRCDDLSVGGFRNQGGVWYSLTGRDGSKMLGTEYSPVPLGWTWGSSYKDFLDVGDSEAAVKKLDFMRPGKEIFMDALRVLSRYPDVEDGEDPRVALARLTIMFCWTACLEPLRQYFRDCWNTCRKEFFSERLMDYIENWQVMSETLLRCKKTGKWSPTDVDQPKLKSIEINNEEDALKVLRLVYNKSEDHGEEYTAPNLGPSTSA